MSRIVVNKNFSNSSNITPSKFDSGGEIIISREKGKEALYVLNEDEDVVKIGSSEGYATQEWVREQLSGYTPGTSGVSQDYVDGRIEEVSGSSKDYTDDKFGELSGNILTLSGDIVTLSGNIITLSGGVINEVSEASATTVGVLEADISHLSAWTIDFVSRALSGDTPSTSGIYAYSTDVSALSASVVSIEAENPDWNETNETKHGYIANKPTVYSEGEINGFISAKTSIIEDEISGLTDDVSGMGIAIDSISATTDQVRRDMASLKREVEISDIHVFLYPSEYEELIASGSVVTEEYGEVIYNDHDLYCVYEEDKEQTQSGGTATISGDTLVLSTASITEDGLVDLTSYPNSYIDENNMLVIVQ